LRAHARAGSTGALLRTPPTSPDREDHEQQLDHQTARLLEAAMADGDADRGVEKPGEHRDQPNPAEDDAGPGDGDAEQDEGQPRTGDGTTPAAPIRSKQPANSPEAAGNAPVSVAVGDFSGDGKRDLATANFNSDNVMILLGDGTGDFSPAPTGPRRRGLGPALLGLVGFGDR
jgi:hypothetical protein